MKVSKQYLPLVLFGGFVAMWVPVFGLVSSFESKGSPLSAEEQRDQEVAKFVLGFIDENNPTQLSAEQLLRLPLAFRDVDTAKEISAEVKSRCDIPDDTNPFYLGLDRSSQDERALIVPHAALNHAANLYFCPDKWDETDPALYEAAR